VSNFLCCTPEAIHSLAGRCVLCDRLPTLSQRLVRLFKGHLLQPSTKRYRYHFVACSFVGVLCSDERALLCVLLFDCSDPNDFREQLVSSDAESIFERHKVVCATLSVLFCYFAP
jgi:hypothetical protein